MAAFLHSKGPGEDAHRHLVACPVFVGAALLLGHLGLSMLLLAFELTQLPNDSLGFCDHMLSVLPLLHSARICGPRTLSQHRCGAETSLPLHH